MKSNSRNDKFSEQDAQIASGEQGTVVAVNQVTGEVIYLSERGTLLRVSPVSRERMNEFWSLDYSEKGDLTKPKTRALSAAETRDFIDAFNGRVAKTDFSAFVQRYGLYGVPGWKSWKTSTKTDIREFLMNSIDELEQLIKNDEISPYEAFDRLEYYYSSIPGEHTVDDNSVFSRLGDIGDLIETRYSSILNSQYIEEQKREKAAEQAAAAEDDMTTIFTRPTN